MLRGWKTKVRHSDAGGFKRRQAAGMGREPFEEHLRVQKSGPLTDSYHHYCPRSFTSGPLRCRETKVYSQGFRYHLWHLLLPFLHSEFFPSLKKWTMRESGDHEDLRGPLRLKDLWDKGVALTQGL